MHTLFWRGVSIFAVQSIVAAVALAQSTAPGGAEQGGGTRPDPCDAPAAEHAAECAGLRFDGDRLVGFEGQPLDWQVTLGLAPTFSPWRWLSYEWKVRGRSPLMVLSRQHAAGFGEASGLQLVETVDYETVWQNLMPCSIAGWEVLPGTNADGADGASEDGVASLRFRRGDRTVTWRATSSADWSEESCADRIRVAVEQRVSEAPYRLPFWVEGEAGWLQTDAQPAGWVIIDGWHTGERTPLRSLPLEPGQHRVRWVGQQGAVSQEATVTIEAGRTTTINVELEPDAPAP